MANRLAGYITDLGLGEHRNYLLGIARPSIEIITAYAPVSHGCSKFGGSPELPADFEWPHHELGPYRFVGQFNLAEIPTAPHGLPADGLLSVFYAWDELGNAFWQDPDYVQVYWFKDVRGLETVEPPAMVRLGATETLRFHLGADLPRFPDDAEARKAWPEWPLSESQSGEYWELRCRLHPSNRYLLGYPFNTTLGYDPTPGPEWRSLLTLSSDDGLDWSWHDGDWLVAFVEEQRLRAGDFSQIKADAG